VLPILLGDVWVIAPGCWHAFTLGPQRLLVFNLLLTTEFVRSFPVALHALTALSQQRLFEGVRSPMPYHPESPGHAQLPSMELESVRTLLTQLSRELQSPQLPGHVALCYGLVFQILGRLERSSASSSGAAIPADARRDPGLVQALRYIESRYAEPITLDDLARHSGYASATLSRKFRQGVGMPPIEYLIRLRLRHACVLLERTDLPVTAVAGRVGFADGHYFSARFRQELRLTPTQFRALATGQHCALT